MLKMIRLLRNGVPLVNCGWVALQVRHEPRCQPVRIRGAGSKHNALQVHDIERDISDMKRVLVETSNSQYQVARA